MLGASAGVLLVVLVTYMIATLRYPVSRHPIPPMLVTVAGFICLVVMALA